MNKSKLIFLVPLMLFILGCTPEPYTAKVGYTNGTTSGGHIAERIIITTLSGGKVNFAMGAIGTYPGKMSTGGRMDAPAHIEGDWAKEKSGVSSGLASYHRISADIPKEAEAKMKLMDNYYQNFDRSYGSMQVIVDGPRIRVFYTKSCVDMYHDCTPKKNIDPNDWVIKSPKGVTDVVVLFDGIGESSKTPFPNTEFVDLDKRREFYSN
ncbi:hypothetical protein [Aliivibrio fischeri]|uniref:hypothetical protein n=1 Tax=Aliivibrio fischeri TaxID=668 RepID=UPI00080DFCDC|nr:hypothetical protein [Aliivibrio fischeri]OCH38082.1 hypothetical protein A6E02_18170 [Aliivibrio fischeri]